MIEAILFDFNGVIIDDEGLQMKAYQEVFAERDVELTEEGYLACLGMSDKVFVETIYKRAGKDPSEEDVQSAIELKTEKWKTEVDKAVPIFDGVGDFVARMAERFSIGIVSMARRREIDYILDKTGMTEHFDVIVSAEDIKTVKPDPACYKEGFRRLDIAHVAKGNNPLTRRQCVVIEDSPPGIQSAKSNRLKALGITSTVDADALRAVGADAVTNDLSDWNAESFRRVF